jgi:peptidoglycan hydrolase-like protein with peptidoglycan-binding domain
MYTKKVRLISAAVAGGLILTGVTTAAIAGTGQTPTSRTLAADTASAVNLDNCPTLAEGYHGGCVNQLQTELNADDGSNLTVDGTFGPATRKAVEIFQQERNIVPADGIVGPQTKAALDNLGSNPVATPAPAPSAGSPTPVTSPSSTAAAIH